MTTLLNNKFFVVFFAPFLLGAITTLGFSRYNLTFINFLTFSVLLFLILIIKIKNNKKENVKKFRNVKLKGGKPSIVIPPSKKGAKKVTKSLLFNKAVKLNLKSFFRFYPFYKNLCL